MGLFDLTNSECVQVIPKAHEASIWSLDYHQNPAGFQSITIISGSADKRIKFWQLVVEKKKKLL